MNFKDFTYINTVTGEEFGLSTKNPIYVLQNIEGVSGVGSNISTVKNVLQDGESFKSTTLNKRNITIELVLRDSTCNYANMERYKNALYRVFNPKHPGILRHNLTGFQLENVYVENTPSFNYGNSATKFALPCTIYLQSPDPYWVNKDLTSIDIANWIGNIKFDASQNELTIANEYNRQWYVRNNMLLPLFNLYSSYYGNSELVGKKNADGYYETFRDLSVNSVDYRYPSTYKIKAGITDEFIYKNLMYLINKMEGSISNAKANLPTSDSSGKNTSESLNNAVSNSVEYFTIDIDSSTRGVIPLLKYSLIYALENGYSSDYVAQYLYMLGVQMTEGMYVNTFTTIATDGTLTIPLSRTMGNRVTYDASKNMALLEDEYTYLVNQSGSQNVEYTYNTANYDILGYRSTKTDIDIKNDGHISCPYTVIFEANGTSVANPQLILDINNPGKYIKLDKTLQAGEIVVVDIGESEIKVTSEINGVLTDNIQYLDYFSNTDLLPSGDNLMSYSASTNKNNLDIIVQFRTRRFGI